MVFTIKKKLKEKVNKLYMTADIALIIVLYIKETEKMELY